MRSPGSPGGIKTRRREELHWPSPAGDYGRHADTLAEVQRDPKKYHRVVTECPVKTDNAHPLENPEDEIDRRFVRSVPGYTGYIPRARGEGLHGLSHGSLSRKCAGIGAKKTKSGSEFPVSTNQETFIVADFNSPTGLFSEHDSMEHIPGYTGYVPKVTDDVIGKTPEVMRHISRELQRNQRQMSPTPGKPRPHSAHERNMPNAWMGNSGHYMTPGSAWRAYHGADPDINAQALQAAVPDRALLMAQQRLDPHQCLDLHK